MRLRINKFHTRRVNDRWIVKRGAKWGDFALCKAECETLQSLIEDRAHCGLCKTRNPKSGMLLNSTMMCEDCFENLDNRPGCLPIDEYGRTVRPKYYEYAK